MALVAGTQQNLSNLYSIDIYGLVNLLSLLIWSVLLAWWCHFCPASLTPKLCHFLFTSGIPNYSLYKHWQGLSQSIHDLLWVHLALLALATLGDTTQIEMILSVSHCPRWVGQVHSLSHVGVTIGFAKTNFLPMKTNLYSCYELVPTLVKLTMKILTKMSATVTMALLALVTLC